MTHWTKDPEKIAKFHRAATNQGYDMGEALIALGVRAITDLRGTIGDALTKLASIKKQAQSQRRITHTPTDSLELVPIGGALSEIYGDPEQLKAIAHRARRFFPWATIKGKPSDLDDVQVLATIQYAHMIGANPANEVHPWFDPKNNVFILMPHYSYTIRKAKEVDPRLMFWCEDMYADDPSLVDGDIGVTCYVRTGPQQDMFVTMLRANVPYEIANKQTCTSAVGIVSLADRTGKNGKLAPPPKGWTWRQRAETRAITNALKRAVGTVAIADQARTQFQALGMPNGGELYLDADTTVELATGEIIEHIAKAETKTPEQALEENRRILNGDLEDGIIIAPPVPQEPSAEPEPEREKPLRMWPQVAIDCIIKAKVVLDQASAIEMLNLSNLQTGDEMDVITRWGQLYREASDAGCDPDDAAGVANAWLWSMLEESADEPE